MKWSVQSTLFVQNQLIRIKDIRIQEQIRKRISALTNDPDKQGKLLGDDLVGFRSVRAVKERYRIIFKVDKDRVVVLIVLVGMRKEGDKKDVYALAHKLIRLGLLDLVAPLLSTDAHEQREISGEDDQPNPTVDA